jgi:adenylate cyclase class IV
LQQAARIARTLGAECAGIERQRDTYFAVAHGRLKVRERTLTAMGTAEGATPVVIEASELIQYHRPDEADARASDYSRINVEDAVALIAALTAALGEPTVVRKKRTIYLHENVRIHLDEVEALGHFLEFEAIVDARTSEISALAKVRRLTTEFQIESADVISASYLNLAMRDGDGLQTP